MSRNIVETVLGAVVLAVAALFLAMAYSSANIGGTPGGYELVARFDRADGLAAGSEVRISGVRVGSVVSQRLDPATWLAEVRISIDPALSLPSDTVAVVASESLLGGRYLALEPGGEADTIAQGGTIQYTQSTPGLEQLLGQVIYGMQQAGQNAPAAGGGGN